ncbi:MAG: hypothetical protein H5U07_01475 [Candidatus Aminicenantes bacterium]|nr:hypothetical protein [Candidatus Aminicenantes bacterium]
MKKLISISLILILILLATFIPTYSQKQFSEDEKLLNEAKVLIFDKNWTEAEKKLNELLTRYPKSSYRSQALFYLGRCLAEQKGREREAWQVMEEFLKNTDIPRTLAEEAEITSIDLAATLYNKGEATFGPLLEEKLTHSSRVIRYYAAFKLSYLKDKKLAARAVPVLKHIVEKEKDPELVDRAKIALLRISPEALKGVKEGPEGSSIRMIKIRIIEKGKRTPSVSINLPLALADLAIQAIPDEQKMELRKKGYDLDKILSDLAKSKEKLVRIEEDGNIIEIWIE